MREEKPLTPCVPKNAPKLSRLPRLGGSGKLGKRAGKAYARTISSAPEVVIRHTRVLHGNAKVIEATPLERYRFAERGIEFPR